MAAQQPLGAPQRVLIHGVLGRMGQVILHAVSSAPDMVPVGGVDALADQSSLSLPGGASIPLSTDLDAVIDASHPQVMVDFTIASASAPGVKRGIARGLHQVIGTTGLSEADLQEFDRMGNGKGVGVFVAPNFALGAVLLIHQARVLARYFDYAEVIEAHHETKIDAPSGTALAIARALVEGHGGPFRHNLPEKEPAPGARGAEHQGVSIHAQRMPGRLAHHEVLLGAEGQTLSLRHDTVGRECYVPGVLTAIREVVQYQGLVLGLDKLLGLQS